MNTIVVYDEAGNILLQMQGITTQGNISCITVDEETYKGKVIKSVNATTKELVLEDIPKTELELTKEKVANLENYILEKETNNTASSL